MLPSKTGMTAPQAAGVIHSDFEKGFIRAETVSTTFWVSVWKHHFHSEPGNHSKQIEG